MSFFDDYKDIGGGEYVGADEKAVIIDEGIPLTVVDVVYQEESQYGERYVIRVLLPDPDTGDEEERLMSFGCNSVESRDRMLKAMAEYLETEGATPPVVKLERVGRAVIIVKGDDEPEPAKPKRSTRAKK